ncbi:hypothetical protein HDV57DRAFT_488371 [Trichoderma longibrachiatum]
MLGPQCYGARHRRYNLICHHAESLPAPAGEPSCRRSNKGPPITMHFAHSFRIGDLS